MLCSLLLLLFRFVTFELHCCVGFGRDDSRMGTNRVRRNSKQVIDHAPKFHKIFTVFFILRVYFEYS